MAALKKAPPSQFSGHLYRVIDDEFRTDPLSGLGSVINGGRYNAPSHFEALYSSDSRITALYEVEALFGDLEQPRSPELILTLAVLLSRVFNVTDPAVMEIVGTDESELTAPYLEDQVREGEATTQRLGRSVHAAGLFSALHVPSRATRKCQCGYFSRSLVT